MKRAGPDRSDIHFADIQFSVHLLPESAEVKDRCEIELGMGIICFSEARIQSQRRMEPEL